MDKTRIAIDGPGGAGKSTIARALSKELQIDYIDTGAMYRAIAYKILKEDKNVDMEEELEDLLSRSIIDFDNGSIYLDGNNVDQEIRKPEVSMMASKCSSKKAVREKLVAIQRAMTDKKSLVMDGRDIGTNVIPDAEYKFYLTATPEVRGQRRYDELLQKNSKVDLQEVINEINARDKADMTRNLNPLKKADDAIEIDTSDMTIKEVVSRLLKEIKGEK